MPKKKAGTLTSGLTSEQAAVICLRDCQARIEAARDRALACDDPEGAHQLRVGLRRLRTLLSLFRPVIGGSRALRLAEAAKHLGREVGRTRDLDVVTTEILPRLAPDLPAGADRAIADRFGRARDRERDGLRARLRQERTTGFLDDLRGFTDRRGWLDPADHGQTGRLARPLGDFARDALARRWKKTAKRAAKICWQSAEQRHALRKDLKKLRYSVEFLAPLYPARKIGAFIKRLKQMQDAAGALNDVAMARRLAGTSPPGQALDPSQRAALDAGLARLERETAPRLDRMAGLWSDLEEARRPWE